jgi:catechol 2,3-dioxygenase-like lactoylglutathione lyase family enzyme
VTLGVRDLGRARAFYEALGWRSGAAPDDDVVFFRAGGTVPALWGRDQLAEDSGVEDSGGWGGVTLAHNVGSPEEVDAVLAEAERGRDDHPPGRPRLLGRVHRRVCRSRGPRLGGGAQPTLDALRGRQRGASRLRFDRHSVEMYRRDI